MICSSYVIVMLRAGRQVGAPTSFIWQSTTFCNFNLYSGGLCLFKPPLCGGPLHPRVRRQARGWGHNYLHSSQVSFYSPWIFLGFVQRWSIPKMQTPVQCVTVTWDFCHETSILKMTGELSKHYCYHENYFYLKIHGLSSVHKSYQFLSSLFHKFCAATSLSDYDPYLLAATSLYLAGKVIT